MTDLRWMTFVLVLLFRVPAVAQESPDFPVIETETIFTQDVSIEEHLPILFNDTQQNENEGQHWLYDIGKRITYPLTQETSPPLSLEWLDNDTILAEVYTGDFCPYCGNDAFIARWYIRS